MRVAAIDCGTNSLRLLVADARSAVASGSSGMDGAPRPRLVEVVRRAEVVRLGQGVDASGRLDPAAIERTLAVSADYAAECRRLGVERVRYVATSAVRDASNSQDFVSGVRTIFAQEGVVPEIVSGDEEALLSFSGATGELPAAGHAGPYLVVDLGGGSTELVLGITEPVGAISLDIGSVRLTERYGILDGGSDPGAIAAAQADVDAALTAAAQVIDLSAVRTLVGVAGTITTVTAAALGLTSYRRDQVDQAQLAAVDVLSACTRMMAMPSADRALLGYMQPGRADVIGAGALIWRSTIERVRAASGTDRVLTSERDILDGIALSIA